MTAQMQSKDTVETENSISVMLLMKCKDTKQGKVIIYYELDVDYKPKGLVPNDEPVPEEDKKEDSSAEYAKIELLSIGALKKSMQCQT